MKRADVDPFHAGPPCRFDAKVAVFPDDAPLRPGAEPAGGFQEWIGVGLVPRGVFASDDRIEGVGDADMDKDLPADPLEAAGDNGHGHPAPRTEHHLHDRIDRQHVGELGEEGLFLCVYGLLDIDRDAHLGCQGGDDVPRGPSAQGIKTVLIEGDAVGVGHGSPAAVVGGHGVGQRAVAVEEEGVVVLELPHGEAGKWGDWAAASIAASVYKRSAIAGLSHAPVRP